MSEKTARKEIPIGYVLKIDGLENARKYSVSEISFDLDCPFCAGKRKMNVNLKKNVFRCNKCSEAGNSVMLHQKLQGFKDTKEAYFDLVKRMELRPEEQKKLMEEEMVRYSSIKEIEPAPIEVRNNCYRELLDCLELKDEHFEDLQRRGLSTVAIIENRYASYPDYDKCEEIAQQVVKKMGKTYQIFSKALESNTIGIPGFYDFGNKPKIMPNDGGYLIPVVNRYGQISCMQIRNDQKKENSEDFHKYSYFSSGSKKTGCRVTGVENIHYVGFDFAKVRRGEIYTTPKTVFLTEGALKADVASSLWKGAPFIALIGVGNTSQLPDELLFLKEHGTEEIDICIDMDYREKEQVARALKKIESLILEAGLKYKMVTWPEEYKGIDDFLLAKRKRKKWWRFFPHGK